MDLGLLDRHFLILGASIMNIFLLKTFGLGFFMVNEPRNTKDMLFGCIIIGVSSGIQSVALACWLSAFIK